MKIEHIAAWCNDLEKTKDFFHINDLKKQNIDVL